MKTTIMAQGQPQQLQHFGAKFSFYRASRFCYGKFIYFGLVRRNAKVPTMTMFATAQPGQLNNSQPNLDCHRGLRMEGYCSILIFGYSEPKEISIKIPLREYCSYEDEFQKQTYITQIGIFDENKNLLGVAN